MSYIENLNNLFKLPVLKQPEIPLPLILLAKRRSGVSQTRIVEKIFSREQEVFNVDEPHREWLRITVEEICREIRENAKVDIAIAPNATVLSSGTDATGTPVSTIGQIVNIQTATGIIR